MTPSLMELEAALTDMLERKDEAEREGHEELLRHGDGDKSADKPAPGEPQIVPVKRNRGLEESGVELRQVSSSSPSPPPHTTGDAGQQQQPAKSRPIDFPRAVRRNPFNDLSAEEHG